MHIKPNAGRRVPEPTRSQLAVLGAIAKYPRGTVVTAKHIACDLGITIEAAQRRVSRMEKAGLIRRGGLELAR